MNRGRPTGGIKLDKEKIAALPERGSANSFAKLIGVSATTMRNWMLVEGLPHEKIGARFFISKSVLLDWLVNHKNTEPMAPW